MKTLRSSVPGFSKKLDQILGRSAEESKKIDSIVSKIIQDVRKKGDSALRSYTKKFDHHTPQNLEVTSSEIETAYQKIGLEELNSLKTAASRIEAFHQVQKEKISSSWNTDQDGILVGEEIRALSRIGIYVPGGLAAYPSTVLMNAIPASVAGVGEIIMVSPWNKGLVNPYTLVAAHLAGVNRIFKIGGAQAIGALAYGTPSIPAVDKIVGPGNIFVATAKRLVFGKVGIDMIAGPTEVVIVADDTANLAFIASDLLSQAEHDPKAISILITCSEKIAKAVLKQLDRQLATLERKEILAISIKKRGVIIMVKDTYEALRIADQIAPEHLELQIQNPMNAVSQLKNAGAIFLGNKTPVAFGDYLAGPNHVLPTSGTARFSSPLGVTDFLKRSSLMEVKDTFLELMGPHVARLARLEGLTAHAASVEIRLQEAQKSGKRKK